MTDVAFFDQLYVEHFKDLFEYAMRRLDDRGLAQNLAQDTLLWAWAKIGKLRTHECPQKWLYRTLKYLVMKEQDKKYHTEVPLADIEYEGILDKIDEDPFDIFSDGLTEKETQILRWRYQEQMSYLEIANELGIQVDAAKKRTLRAVQQCKKLLTACGNSLHP